MSTNLSQVLMDIYYQISARQVDFGRKTYLDDVDGDGYGSWNLSYGRSAQYGDSSQYGYSTQYDHSTEHDDEEESDYSDDDDDNDDDDDDDDDDEEVDSDDLADDVTCSTGDNDVIECAAKTDQVSING